MFGNAVQSRSQRRSLHPTSPARAILRAASPGSRTSVALFDQCGRVSRRPRTSHNGSSQRGHPCSFPGGSGRPPSHTSMLSPRCRRASRSMPLGAPHVTGATCRALQVRSARGTQRDAGVFAGPGETRSRWRRLEWLCPPIGRPQHFHCSSGATRPQVGVGEGIASRWVVESVNQLSRD